MPIIGHGIDLIEVARIAQMLERHGQRFLDRVFTPAEQAYAASSKRTVEHLAARFAAKEAALKALGTGWRDGIAWTDVEIIIAPTGKPSLMLHHSAAEIAKDLGIRFWTISLTHTSSHAIASVIGES
jgi:holo-[acyl-carrier protein] synthase